MYLCIPEGNRILSMSRKDYSISTGFGFNVISTKQFNYYLQLCGGIGIIDGSYEHFTPNNGTERIDIKHTSYIISPSTGIDFIVANHWKIGAGYTFRYLGDFDGSHSLFARITYVFDQDAKKLKNNEVNKKGGCVKMHINNLTTFNL